MPRINTKKNNHEELTPNGHLRFLYVDSRPESMHAKNLLKSVGLEFIPQIVPDDAKHGFDENPKPPLLITGIGRYSGLSLIKMYIKTPALWDATTKRE